MVNCVECGAPLERAGDPCDSCGAARLPSTTNGTSHPRFEDPDGLVYEDSPLVRGDADAPHHVRDPHEPREPAFVKTPLRDDPAVESPAFASAPPVAQAPQPAPFVGRAIALAIDVALLSVLDVVLLALATGAVMLAERVTGARVGGAVDLVRAAVSAGSLTLFVGYFSVLHARSGQTLGKVAMRIRVLADDGGRVGMLRGVIRTLSYALSALLFGAGFLLALFPTRRALHDRIAGTVVVRVEGDA